MKLLSLFFILFSSLCLKAQQFLLPEKSFEYPKEIALKINTTYQVYKQKLPNKDILRKMPLNTKLPKNLHDTLYKYDWLEVGRYDYSSNTYHIEENAIPYLQYHKQKGIFSFVFKPLLSTGASLFFEHNDSNLPQRIQKKGTYFYYFDEVKNNENIHHYPVVDYKNKFLIIDINRSGKLNDIANPDRYRMVYLAILKMNLIPEDNQVSMNQSSINKMMGSTDDDRVYSKENWTSKSADVSSGKAIELKDFYEKNKYKIPDEVTLKRMPLNTNLIPDINDILYTYDLLEVATYTFLPLATESGYALSNPSQFYLYRYHSKKGVLKFNFFNHLDDSYITFANNDNNIPYIITKKGTHFYYMDTSKQPDYYPVVDYKDGLLIIDITHSAKMNDFSNPRRFRIVYMLVPKVF